MLYFQPPSSEGGEGGQGKEEISSPHHARGSSSSFTETYPHFLAWQYDVMNFDGTYSSMPLTRPEQTPNVPWPDPVCSCIFISLSLFLLGLMWILWKKACK